VQRLNWSSEFEYIGLAWARTATFLPNIKYSASSWDTQVVAVNEDATPKDTIITFSSGPQSTWWSLSPHLLWRFLMSSVYPGGFNGSIIVNASEDGSAVAITRKSSPIRAHAFTGAAPAGSGSLIQAGASAYLPILYRHATWGYYSTIAIQNAGATSASVTVTFYQTNGAVKHTQSYSVPANGVTKIDLQSAFSWSNYFGTAVVSSSNQPVAVTVESTNSARATAMSYNALPVGWNDVYLPYLMKNYGGWGSCFVAQNTTASTATVYPTYYHSNGSQITGLAFNLAPYASQTVCQSSVGNLPDGASAAYIYASQPIALVVNQDKAGNQVMSYSGLGMSTSTATLSYLLSGYASGSETWNSGVTVQNLGSEATDAVIQLYDSAGSPSATYTLAGIQSRRAKSVYLPNIGGLPGNFSGSAVVMASQPVLVLTNASCSAAGCAGDTSYTYNGVNR
jgi:hypothetical protein